MLVATTPPPMAGMVLPPGFTIARIATIPKPRELASLPNGDLLVASEDARLWIVPAAGADEPPAPQVFATIDDPAESDLVVRATHLRNAIALAVDPFDGDVWASDAGQDELPLRHPYEFFDDLSARTPPADYGWPRCEENRIPYVAGADCSETAVPLAVLPAHHTPIGAVFYPFGPLRYGFPLGYRGAAFVTLHGSSRPLTGCYDAPEIVAIPMREGRPNIPVDWADPRAQLSPFVSGLEPSCLDVSQRRTRPTGIAVGPDGSLFFSDDLRNGVYRIRV